VRRPVANLLGEDVIRFSSQPALGGDAVIVEMVSTGSQQARVRVFRLEGHPREGWARRHSAEFTISSARFQNLATAVDAASAGYVAPVVSETGETIICTDGPGYLTEHIREGRVTILAGSCPPDQNRRHVNRVIADRMFRLARQTRQGAMSSMV
jgi:hypothetical protein